MIEKIPDRKGFNPYRSGYFKPQGRYAKRQAHKAARRAKILASGKGYMNRVWTVWEWD